MNMRIQKGFFLFLPLLLTGCTGQSTSSAALSSTTSADTSSTPSPSSPSSSSSASSSQSSEDPVLQNIASALEAVSPSATLTGDYLSMYPSDGSTYDEGSYEVSIGADFYYVEREYADVYGNATSEEHTFKVGEEGQIQEQTISLLNVPSYVDYVNPFTDETMKAGELLSNPFAALEAEDFTSVGSGLYELSQEKLSAFAGFATFENIRSDRSYECEIESAVFEILDGSFTTGVVTTKAQSDGMLIPDDFIFEFTFEIAPCEFTEAPVISAYEHREEHGKLKKAFDSLDAKIQEGNYTVVADDEETGGEFSMQYETYYTKDVIYSTFRPLIYTYTEGYVLSEGSTFQHFYYYTAGENAGTAKLSTTGSRAYKDRQWLDVDVSSFAVEFFHEDRENVFVTSDPHVVAEIGAFLCPFIDKLDPYYIANKVEITLDSNGEISTIARTAYDWAAGCTDVFTYTITDVGTTTIPEEVLAAL